MFLKFQLVFQKMLINITVTSHSPSLKNEIKLARVNLEAQLILHT